MVPCIWLISQQYLVVEISRIEQLKGNLMIAVHDSDSTLLIREVVAKEQVKVTGSNAKSKLKLFYDSFAIGEYHDVNSNGELDRNLSRILKEPVGFSTNAKDFKGPPKYFNAKFSYNYTGQKIQIKSR